MNIRERKKMIREWINECEPERESDWIRRENTRECEWRDKSEQINERKKDKQGDG